MARYGEMPSPFINKLSGLVLILLGFLLATAGYRYGHAWYIAGGIVFLALGLVSLVRKIIRRNQGDQAGGDEGA
jgi:hypothetical protein